MKIIKTYAYEVRGSLTDTRAVVEWLYANVIKDRMIVTANDSNVWMSNRAAVGFQLLDQVDAAKFELAFDAGEYDGIVPLANRR